MAKIVISRIQHRRGRRENLPQPLLPAEIALTSDTSQAWMGQDPILAVPSINVYTDKLETTAQGIVDNNIVETRFDENMTITVFNTLVAELKLAAGVTLVNDDILWDDTYRGTIETITVTTPGTGYTTGNAITAISATGSGFVGTVTAAAGAITGVTITNGGTNFRSANTTFSIAGGTGGVLSVAVTDIYGSTVHIAANPTIDVGNTVANITSTIAGLSTTITNRLLGSTAFGGTFVLNSLLANNHTEAANVSTLMNRVNGATPGEITGLVFTNLNIEITGGSGGGGGSTDLAGLSDVDLTGAADNDMLFRSGGNWIDTAGEMIWNPTGDFLQLANAHSINWLDTGAATTELLAFTADTFIVGDPAFDTTIDGLTTSINSDTVVTGTLDVTGATTLAGATVSTLSVTAAATFATTLGVTGAATFATTLGVTGATDFTGLADFHGNIILDNLDVIQWEDAGASAIDLLSLGLPLGGDPDFASVVLLYDFTGADAATSTTDASNSAHVGTFVGNAQIDTSQSNNGTASLRLDGNGDWVTIPDSTDWTFGSGDFTIDIAVRFNTVPGGAGSVFFASHYEPNTSDRSWTLRYTDGIGLRFIYSTDGINSNIVDHAWLPVINTWFQIRISRIGPNLYVFIDGVLQGSAFNVGVDSFHDSSHVVTIGALGNSTLPSGEFDGWIDDLRITTGLGRSSTSFSLPAGAWPLAPPGETFLVGDPAFATKVFGTEVTLSAAVDVVLSAAGAEAVRYVGDGTDIIESHEVNVGLTADVGSAQGNGVITSSYNVYSTVAAIGHAATLPATFLVGALVYVKNDGANSMNVFPALGDDAGGGTDTAVALGNGTGTLFMGTVADATWTQML